MHYTLTEVDSKKRLSSRDENLFLLPFVHSNYQKYGVSFTPIYLYISPSDIYNKQKKSHTAKGPLRESPFCNARIFLINAFGAKLSSEQHTISHRLRNGFTKRDGHQLQSESCSSRRSVARSDIAVCHNRRRRHHVTASHVIFKSRIAHTTLAI